MTGRRVRGALRVLAAVLVGAAAVPAGAAAARPAGEAGQAAGEIVDFEILPDVLTVDAGTTVTWTNGGARPHTVTDRGGTFDTGPILPGEQGSATLAVPGNYEVFCRINPSTMNARIAVAPPTEAVAKPAARIQAVDEAREGETQRFDPAELEVVAGTTVTLANVGGLPHSLRTDDGSLRIPVVEPGAEQGRFAGGNRSVVATEPGTYGFFCDIHPEAMRGTLVVTAAPAGGAPPATEAEERPPETPPPDDPDPPPQAGEADATMADFEFAPVETAVDPGATVTWRNDGDEPHTAVFDDLDIDLGPVAPGEEVSATAPDDPGTYSYRCDIHPGMRGVLLVRAPVVAGGDFPRPAEPPDGSIVAYTLAALFVATGGGGLVLALRRPTA